MQDMVLEEEVAKALKIFEAIAEEGHRQAAQIGTEEGDQVEAVRQAILEGLTEARWEAKHQEQARRAFEALAAADRVREAVLALQEELAGGWIDMERAVAHLKRIPFLTGGSTPHTPSPCISFLTGTPPHEDASTNTSPIPQSPASSTIYMRLPRFIMPSPDSTYATPSFIERFDLFMIITKTELTPKGVIHYGHPTTALPVHSPPLLIDNTIMVKKNFHDAIISLEQYARIEGALRQLGEPNLTADIRRYCALTLDIEEEHCLITLHEQCWPWFTIDRWDVSA
ncbi:hypothetical protein EW146_g3315 [Bondarzewia mesenterica]|uniref:Uncharacterized protein n=1 Tax=Bondarzewia mesenterica TaxID=1095465 RepID=A0A4S4LZQ9_9AGAM|nr:hypothetical protein EW146_g3315 [Bondarzewia mesenterica]